MMLHMMEGRACVCVIVRGKQEGREVAERVCLEGGESEGGGM